MPTYVYICTECQQETEIKASISEKEKGLKVSCPNCGSSRMAQVFGSFMIKGSGKRKSEQPPPCGPNCACNPFD